MSELTVDQKFARLIITLRKLQPFNSALFESIEKKELSSIKTVATDGIKIFYNYDYVDSISVKKFNFVMLHELYHIALKHALRLNGRDKKLWNVACDLYVNRLLALDLDLEKGIDNPKKDIIIPADCLYAGNIDIDNDCVEDIYDRLNEMSNSNGYNDTGEGEFNLNSLSGSGKNNESSNIKNISRDDEDEFVPNQLDAANSENNVNRILSEAQVKSELMSGGNGKEAGTGACNLDRLVKELLKSHLDWRKLLRKYCIQLKSCDTSFAYPDKRMSYQDAIYPGRSISTDNALKDVKIAIDTSGSISEVDMKYILGQIYGITKQYKVDAEIICWDAYVETAYNFKDVSDIFKSGITGGGGTDASCVFEYLDSKKCKIKPKVTIVFTDGYWDYSGFKNSWTSKYKNTIWVMTRDYNKNFKPPFGRIAIAKFE